MIRKILLFLIASGILLASGGVSELEKRLETASPRERFEILLTLAGNAFETSPPKAIEYATRALHLSRQLENKIDEGLALQKIGKGHMYSFQYKKALDFYYRAQRIFETLDEKTYLAEVLRKIGFVFLRTSDYEKALTYYNRGLKYLDKTANQKKFARFLNDIGLLYYLWGKLDTAVEYFMEGIKITETTGTDEDTKGICTANLGRTYRRLGDYEKALQCLNQALTIAKKLRRTLICSFIYREIAEVYKEQAEFDTAIDYCNKSMRILDKEKHKRQNGATLLLLAEIHTARKHFQKALDYAQQALKNFREVDSKSRTADALTMIGYIHKEMGQFPEALKYLKQGAEISKQLNITENLQNGYLYLSETFSAMGNSDQSLRYYKKYNEVKENVFNKRAVTRLRNTHVKYETEKMQKEIEGVKTSRQTISHLFSGVVVLLVIVMMFMVYNRRRIKKRAQIMLAQKDREIEFHIKKTNRLSIQLKELLSRKKEKKYEKSKLTPQQEEAYLKKLLRYMEREKPHLDSELTVKTLSGGLSVSHRDISRVINEKTGMHFYDFINRYRVEEAKRLLEESTLREGFTILDIAYEVGFNSKSSFNSAFKKINGITPSQYKKACLPPRRGEPTCTARGAD